MKKQIKNYYTDNNTDKLPLLKCAIMGRQEGCIEFLLKQFPQLRHSKLESLAQQYGIDYSGILCRVREKTLPNCVLALTKNDDVVESLLLLKMMADENYANTKEMYQAFLGNYITRLELQLKYRPLYEDKRYPLSVLEVHNSLRELAEHGVHEAESFFKKAFDHQGKLRPGFYNKPTESTATNSDTVIDLLPFSPS